MYYVMCGIYVLTYFNIWYRQLKLLSREYLDTGLIRNKTLSLFKQKIKTWTPEVCPL